MTTTVIRRALVAALCLLRVAPSVLAFAPPDAASSFTTQYVSTFRHRLLAQRPIPSPAARRSLPVARAADSPEPPSPSPSIALPATYAAAAAGLVYRALQSTDRVEAAVLFSTAALALVNFGPIDRSLLTSADLADGLNPPRRCRRGQAPPSGREDLGEGRPDQDLRAARGNRKHDSLSLLLVDAAGGGDGHGRERRLLFVRGRGVEA